MDASRGSVCDFLRTIQRFNSFISLTEALDYGQESDEEADNAAHVFAIRPGYWEINFLQREFGRFDPERRSYRIIRIDSNIKFLD